MDTFYETGVIVLMFIVRLGAPLLVTIAIVAWLRRLDARWQAEAMQEQETPPSVSAQEAPVAPPLPCWTLRNCPPERRDRCSAYMQPSLACWLARKQVEGRLPELCLTCLIFKPPPLIVAK